MTPNWHAEIVDLHAFFEGWLGGALPNSDEVFARLPDTMAEGFALVGPDGRLRERGDVLAWLRPAHGSRPGWRIWIERPQLRLAHGDILCCTYEEHQAGGGHTNARLSTVLFRARPGAPNGLEWLHVHESWLGAP